MEISVVVSVRIPLWEGCTLSDDKLHRPRQDYYDQALGPTAPSPTLNNMERNMSNKALFFSYVQEFIFPLSISKISVYTNKLAVYLHKLKTEILLYKGFEQNKSNKAYKARALHTKALCISKQINTSF